MRFVGGYPFTKVCILTRLSAMCPSQEACTLHWSDEIVNRCDLATTDEKLLHLVARWCCF